MKTEIGVGYSNQSDSFLAGQTAAMNAIKQISSPPDFVLAFCSGKHQPDDYLSGVRSITGQADLVGGAALGVFTNDQLSYASFEGSVTVFASDHIRFKTFTQGDLDKDEFSTGQLLAEQIKQATSPDDKGLLVFYDSAKQASPPLLNFATPLFQPIDAAFDSTLTCAGAGILGDMQLTTSYQFYNDRVLQQSVVAVLISGACGFYTTIMHGCRPGSSYHTITKAKGPVVYEIDHRPAIDVIDEMLGAERSVPWREFALYVTLGVNKGDQFGPFNEVDYANRLCLAVDEDQKALVMFEPDLKAGDLVQLMHRSVNLEYIQKGVNQLLVKAGERKPLYYFYINCAGRAKPYAGGEIEDVEELQQVLDPTVPFMGFYSGVEVAKLGGHLQALDWTGVLCLLTEP